MINSETATLIRSMIAASGMTQKTFAEYFGIPLRSVENWASGARECPKYLLDLMQFRLDHDK